MPSEKSKNIVVIGAGTGGPNTLKTILADMPELDASLVIVQHMSKQLNRGITRRFNESTEMPVKLAEDQEVLLKGRVYVAPTGRDLEIDYDSIIRLTDCSREKLACPSINVTMRSLTGKKGRHLVGIILSGIGHDGVEGIKHISEIEGTPITQKVSSAIIAHMPEKARDTGRVKFVLRPIAIRAKLIMLFKKR